MKKTIQAEITSLLGAVANGDTDALEAFISLREVSNLLENAIESLKAPAYAVADSKIGTTVRDVKISMSKGRTTWDYKPVTAWLKIQEDFKAKLKMVEEEAMKKYNDSVENGTLYLANELPNKKVGEPFLSLTFPK